VRIAVSRTNTASIEQDTAMLHLPLNAVERACIDMALSRLCQSCKPISCHHVTVFRWCDLEADFSLFIVTTANA
jgi:hypothetical protein